MPHLVILYTPNLDAPPERGGSDMGTLCRALAAEMVAARDEAGQPVFPTGGVRVLAYPATHFAVGDGGAAGRAQAAAAPPPSAAPGQPMVDPGDYAFVYLNLRMARGRSEATQQAVGRALEACAKAHFAPQFALRPIGVTLQVDVGPEVFDAKNSSLHPLFRKS